MIPSVLLFFAMAALSGLGVGSAGLPVIYLTLAEGLPQLQAQGVSLIFFLFSSGAALLVHLLRTPPLRTVWLLLPTALLGAWLGSSLALVLAHEFLRSIFAVFLMLTGALGLFRKPQK